MSKCTTACLGIFDSTRMWGVFSKKSLGYSPPFAMCIDREAADEIMRQIANPDAVILPVVVAGTTHICPHGDERFLDVSVPGGELIDIEEWERKRRGVPQ